MSAVITCADCGAAINDATDDDSLKHRPCAACGSTKRGFVVTPDSIHLNLSPIAFQWYAKDFYEAYKAYKNVKGELRFSPARLTLLAQAFELAAKSLHVHRGKQDADLRKIGHDLVKACDSTILGPYQIRFTANEATELKKLSDLNKAKAFEYFWFLPPGIKKDNANPEQARLAGVMHAVTGRAGLPDESVIERLLIKLLTPTM